MKKIACSLTCLLLLLAIPQAHAQLFIGARVGLNLANESITPASPNTVYSGHTGAAGGLQIDYKLNSLLAISLQPTYQQSGVHYETVTTDSSYMTVASGDITLNYLQIPLLLRATFGGSSSQIRPYVFAGPSMGLLLSADNGPHKVSTPVNPKLKPVTTDSTLDVKSDYQSTDLSLLFGAGVSYELESGASTFLDAGYGLGLANIYKNTSATIKSTGIRIMLGFVFPL